MRLWDRKPRVADTSRRTPTKVSRVDALDKFRQRKPFSNPLEEQSFEHDDLAVHGYFSEVGASSEPTDLSKGGKGQVNQFRVERTFPKYTVTNGLTDRTYNADATSTGELADVLNTLISDCQTMFEDFGRRLRDA